MTIIISTECPTRAPEYASPIRKGAQKVCEPTSGSIFARIGYV